MEKPKPSNSPQLFIAGGIVAVLIGFLLPMEEGDANIGAGILVLFGGTALLTGITRLAMIQKSNSKKLILAAVAAMLIVLSAGAWLSAENESNRVYCEEKITNGETIPEGEEFCDQFREGGV